MYNIAEFFAMFRTLLHTWGGDTPSEATWAANELIDFLVLEYDFVYEKRFHEYPENDVEAEHNSSILPELEAILGPIGEARERKLNGTN